MVSGGERGRVEANGVAGRDCGVEVVLAGGILVRVRPGFDADTLLRLVSALNRRC
jgi:hypothetical protein